ncbi:transglycosylase domain-containing protein [bacterium]|nr:transglycosylase domain-containing protein [bacterium]
MNDIQKKIRAVLARRQRNTTSHRKVSLKKFLVYSLLGFLGLFLAGVIILTILIAILSIGLPDVHDIDKLSVAQSTTIYDKDNNVLYVKHGDENREYVPYDKISKHLIDATVSIEDKDFWHHKGFDLPAIIKAGMYEVFGVGSKRGGSTITQQYVKNAFLTSEHSYTRKIKELILAVRLEQAYSKKTILELYLNKIPYGNTAYGIQKAAEIYFGKNAQDLDIAESSILAGLPQAPSYYNPYGPHRNSELLVSVQSLIDRNIYDSARLDVGVDYKLGLIGKNYQIDDEHHIYIPGRSDLILRKMDQDGYITDEEKKTAWEKLQSLTFEKHISRMKAPHFVFYVIEQLEEKYGKEVVEQGGLQVYTTIDPQLQEIAERVVKEGADKNITRFNATNAALVAIDQKTGEILAMVGSKDYFDEDIDGNVNIATSYKQPGSSFKPYVYAQAFYNRYAPASVIYDVRTQFGGGKPPNNYDGAFRGPMTMRAALAQSRNIPAIKAYFLGGEQEPILNLAERMGIKFITKDRDYGWPLALGTAEVRLLDHTSAFGVFGNGGKRMAPVSILKVKNAQGDILEEVDPNKKPEEVLDPQIAYLITSILSDTSVRLGPNLTVPGQVNAAKTGTSNKKVGNVNIPSNLWTIGYTTHIVTGVWAGNSDDRQSGNLYATANGYDAAAPIWKNFMVEAHKVKDWGYEEFPVPQGIQTVSVSAATGKLPGANIPPEGLRSDVFASFALPTEVDNSFAKVKIDTRNGLLANEWCPADKVEEKTYRQHHAIVPTFASWEAGVQSWATARAAKEGESSVGVPPTEVSPLCNKKHFNSARSIKITQPSGYEKIEVGNLSVKVKEQSDFPIENVKFYLDETLQSTIREKPYVGNLRISRFLKPGSAHTIKAVLTDIYGYTAQSAIQVRIKGAPKEEAIVPLEQEPAIAP